jgi:hypothetical protein
MFPRWIQSLKRRISAGGVLFFCLFSALPLAFAGQPAGKAFLKGRVTDIPTGQAIASASIALSSGLSTSTDGYGNYSLAITIFTGASYQVSCSKNGYSAQTQQVWLQPSQTRILDFSLTPSAPQDTTPPTGSIKINNDASYTTSTSVTLHLSAQDNAGGSGLSQMQFSNDNINWSGPEAYTATKTWAIALGDGTKTVYVKFKDAAGNYSTIYSDSIILDTNPPRITATIPIDGYTAYENTTINVSATVTDSGSASIEYRFSIDGTVEQDWSTQPTYSWQASAGVHTIKIEVKDTSGQDTKQAEVCVFRRPNNN